MWRRLQEHNPAADFDGKLADHRLERIRRSVLRQVRTRPFRRRGVVGGGGGEDRVKDVGAHLSATGNFPAVAKSAPPVPATTSLWLWLKNLDSDMPYSFGSPHCIRASCGQKLLVSPYDISKLN